MIGRWAVLGLLAGLASVGCGGNDVHAVVTVESSVPYREAGTDVIVLVLDTLRPDHLSQYGYALDTSPGLAELAAVSTRFEAAYAPSPWTLPSTTTLFTGLHPWHHQMRRPGDVLPEAMQPMAERLREAGWRTHGYSHNVSISPKHGFNQGFDRFTSNTGKVLAYPHAKKLLDVAREDLKAAGPHLLYLHPMNCHGPYKVPPARKSTLLGREPKSGFAYYRGPMQRILGRKDLSAREDVSPAYLQSLQEQYDTATRYTTDVVGDFLADLRKQGRFDDALVILTADHGEELFDHQGFSHGYTLHREVLQVPLFVKLPGQKAAATVREPVSLADLLPTVLEVTGLPSAEGIDGRSLVPALRGELLPPRPLAFDVMWPKRIVAQGLLQDAWMYMRIESNYEGLSNAERLYDMMADSAQTHDLSAAEPERIAAMRAALETVRTAAPDGAAPENRLSDEDRKQLEALGYVE